MKPSVTRVSRARASQDEFGLWYQDQSPSGPGRFHCWFGAALVGVRSIDDVAAAFEFVFRAHPELCARFRLDDDGTLIKELPTAGESLAIRRANPDLDEVEVVRRMGSVPLSLEEGRLMRVAILAGDGGIARGLVGVVHHIAWDARSEKRLWAELDHVLDLRAPAAETGIGAAWLSPLDPIPLGFTAPDRQVAALAGGAVAWSAVVEQARGNGMTPFTWLLGQFISIVAAWSATGRVIPMVDLDDGTDDGTGRFGVHQSQRPLNVVERAASAVDIGRRVQLEVLELLAAETRPSSQPEPQAAGAQACKVYLRDLRSRDSLRHLRPFDLAAPVARNELSVGVAVTSDGVGVLLTARAASFGHDDIAELADRVGRTLRGAVQKMNRLEEAAHEAL